MQVYEKNVEGLNKYLSQMLRCGDNWVAYDSDSDPANLKNVMTFKKICTASRYCEMHSWFCEQERHFYEFQPILNVVNLLGGGSAIQKSDTGLKQLEDQLMHFSITHCKEYVDLIKKLGDGQFHPVKLLRKVVPSNDIESYTVIEHFYPEWTTYTVFDSLIFHEGFSSFYDAQRFLNHLMDKYANSTNSPDLILIGKINCQEVELDFEYFPQPGTGILYKYASPKSSGKDKIKYEVERINEPGMAVDVVQHKMAKFDWLTSTLEFFDGAMQKVSPYAPVPYLDFQRLAYSTDIVYG
jgi:hypothetical protein